MKFLKLRHNLLLGISLSIVLNSAPATQFPIATSKNPEASSSAAFDGVNYLVGVQGDEDDHSNIIAQLINSAGSPVGGRIKTGRTGNSPTVAFDGVNYLMVWTDTANQAAKLFGQFISPAGTLVRNAFPITSSTQEISSIFNSLIFDGTNYFSIWRDERNGENNSDIRGRFITPLGTFIGPEIVISDQPRQQRHPAAAFDGTNYLVVWTSEGPEVGKAKWETYGRLISRSGKLGDLLLISQTKGAVENTTAVAFDGNNYLVAWVRDVSSSSTGSGDIYCRFVSPVGVLAPSEFAFVDDPGDQVFPSLAFDGTKYLLCWSDSLGATNSQVRFQFLDTTGAAVSSRFGALSGGGPNVPLFASIRFDARQYLVISTAGRSDTRLDLTPGDVYGCIVHPLPRNVIPIAVTSSSGWVGGTASDGNNRMLAMQGDLVTNVPTSRFKLEGQLISEKGARLGPKIGLGLTDSEPYVAFDGTNYLFISERSDGNGLDGVYGQFVTREGMLSGPAFSITHGTGTRNPDAVLFGADRYLVLWRDQRAGKNQPAIIGQFVSPSGNLIGSEIAIALGDRTQVQPSAIFDGKDFLVVYQAARAGLEELYDTYGKFLANTGLMESPILLSQNPSHRYNPTHVTFDGTNYLAVWNRDAGTGFPNAPEWNIHARILTRSGLFLGNEFPITTASGDQVTFGTSVFDGSVYLLSWIDLSTSSIQSRYFSRSGEPLTREFSLFRSQGARFPIGGILLNGSHLLAVASYVDSSFSNGDVYALPIPQSRVDLLNSSGTGEVSLRLTGIPEVSYVVQASDDLRTSATAWINIAASNSISGTFNIVEKPSSSRRIYRAIQQ